MLTKEVPTKIYEFPIVFGSYGLRLQGKILFPDRLNINFPIPGAVLCHGFGASHRAVKASARILASKGIATLIFDFRGHGLSEGIVDGKMVEDVIDAWNFLSQFPGVDNKRIGLIGHSLGAMSVIMAAKKINNLKALVALSCPPEINEQLLSKEVNLGCWGQEYFGIKEHPKHGAFPWLQGKAALICRAWMYLARYQVRVDWHKFFTTLLEMRMSDVLQKLRNCPKLFVFCQGDKVTPYQQSVFVYESACEPKEILVMPGGFHTTPLLPGKLRTQWINWAITTLTKE